jgi:hypothetical protein
LDPTNKSFEETAPDRRQGERHNLSATAEVVEIASGIRLSTRAADLSQSGCYLDTLNPFAIGSNVQVSIRPQGAELRCAAVVRDAQSGMGMGIAFTDLDDARKALIESLIGRLGSPALADFPPPHFPENAKPGAPQDQREALAVRLIDLLHERGLLSPGDVASLLRDRSCKPRWHVLVSQPSPVRLPSNRL